MFTVLNSCRDENGSISYAVCDYTNNQGIEIITEEELKLLVTMSLHMQDSKHNLVRLENDNLILDVEEISSALEEEISDDDDDIYAMYDDLEDEEDSDIEEDSDLEDNEDDFTDYDIEEDFEEESEDEEDFEYEDYDLTDYEERSEMDEYYYSYIEANGGHIPDIGNVVLLPKHEKQHGAKVKDDEDDEESIASKLYSYLTEDQKKMLQEYYIYMGKRIFNLERGVNALPVKRRADLDAVRNTGDNWVYAGFVDMGYKGTSICPVCSKSLGEYGVSACHQAPILVKSKYKVEGTGKKGVPAEYKEYVSRTYNGVCSHPQCHKRCSVVTDSVGMRTLDRSNQQGVVCSNCGTLVPQSSHYCTFNDPVRYMHIAWDITVSDLETGFYGQFATERIENLIDSNNCIKFGLSCTAEFFDIAKDSDAFIALKNVQNVCIKDMKEMEDAYSGGNTEQHFEILDALVDKLLLVSTKHMLLKKEEYLPTKMLQLFKDMRASNMIVPRSLVQFIRDFLVDWDVHKFRDNEGELFGNNRNNFGRCMERITLVMSELFGKKYMIGWNYYKDSISSVGTRNKFVDSIYRYISLFFTTEICGQYKYDAINYTDEGGRAQDENGVHARNLSNQYYVACWKDCKSWEMKYNVDTLKEALDALTLLSYLDEVRLTKLVDFTFKQDYSNPVSYRGKEYYAYALTKEDVSYLYGSARTRLLETLFKCIEDRDDLVVIYKKLYNGNDTYTKRLSLFGTTDLYSPSSTRNKYECLKAIEDDILALYKELSIIKDMISSSVDTLLAKYNKDEEIKIDKRIADEEEYARIKAEQEAERLKIEEENRLKEEADRIEKEKAKMEASSFTQEELNNIKTSDNVVKFLQSKNLESFKGKFDFALKLVDELKKRDKEPTPNQFKYIQPLYEAYTGTTYEGLGKFVAKEKVKLEDRTDLEEAVKWVVNNAVLAKDIANKINLDLPVEKTLDIIRSINRYKTISEAQMKYAKAGLKIYQSRDLI